MYKAESEHSWWQLIVHSCDQLWLLVIWKWLACLYMTLWISMYRSAKFILKRTQQISASPHYHIKNYYWISFILFEFFFHRFKQSHKAPNLMWKHVHRLYSASVSSASRNRGYMDEWKWKRIKACWRLFFKTQHAQF